MICLTSDLKHDATTVDTFIGVTTKHLKDSRCLDIDQLVQFTDTCAAQYRSKVPFRDIANAEQVHGVKITRRFFGSRHGKGPSDGAVAVVKAKISIAVGSREATLKTAKELYNYCVTHMTKGAQDSDKKCGHY